LEGWAGEKTRWRRKCGGDGDGGGNGVVEGHERFPLVGRNWNCKIIIFFSFCADVSFASCLPASVSLRIKTVNMTRLLCSFYVMLRLSCIDARCLLWRSTYTGVNSNYYEDDDNEDDNHGFASSLLLSMNIHGMDMLSNLRPAI
jgi:hypothetical protein